MPEPERCVIVIGKEEEGARLDAALSLALSDTSRSYLQKLIADGQVSIDGSVCTVKKTPVREGQEIVVLVPPPTALKVEAEEIPLDIVYEDQDLLVVDKPRGMVVHPAPGNPSGTLVNALLWHCGSSLSSINGVIRPGIVHRIDKDTSGLLMVAKNDKAHVSLSEQLAAHTITRRYQAVVLNNFKEDEGTVDAPIGRDSGMRLRQAVTDKHARHAVTHYKVLERFGRYTLIEARLETGRTHQIRVHMAYIKHPLLGDDLYGRGKNPFGVSGQVLHAGVLGFVHPSTGAYMEFTSPLPAYFTNVLDKLRRAER
ncbi:MAG: RluA family pseudouridine synthase [Clostridiales bacterium]|nr:RluA family pseudouridine synthase [Clostridiales bacterium]